MNFRSVHYGIRRNQLLLLKKYGPTLHIGLETDDVGQFRFIRDPPEFC